MLTHHNNISLKSNFILFCIFVSEPYTSCSAKVHLARILELLLASGPQDALREGRSPSLLETLTHVPTPGKHKHKLVDASQDSIKSRTVLRRQARASLKCFT